MCFHERLEPVIYSLIWIATVLLTQPKSRSLPRSQFLSNFSALETCLSGSPLKHLDSSIGGNMIQELGRTAHALDSRPRDTHNPADVPRRSRVKHT